MDKFRRTGIALSAPATIARLLLVAGALIVWQYLNADPVAAQTAPDTACKLCHVGNEDKLVLPSGEEIKLGVDLDILQDSVHGTHAVEQVYCSDCHAARGGYRYPHEPNPAQNLAEFAADASQNCEFCHTSLSSHNPGHLMASEDAAVPVCSDCHGAHDVAPTDPMVEDPIGTCQSCHGSYDDLRLQSVHDEIVANLGPEQDCQTCHGGTHQPVDAKCKTCHSLLSRQLTLATGESVNLHVVPNTIIQSVHGDREIQGVEYSALACTDCHTQQAFTGYPHQPVDTMSRREFTVEMEAICQDCHQEIYAAQRDSVHEDAIHEGNLFAATCFDCHGNHAIQDPDEPKERISRTCGTCHSEIYEEYSHSVHGAALGGEAGDDVPVCTDCHGVHSIESPLTARFRIESPTLCGGCHADEELMGKYGISTDVFDTYVADFHGTTVELFEKQSPDHETNKAVCYDCHGVHNILPVNDENSQVIKSNLLTTCQKCHPDATTNFPDAWTSHYKPSLEHNALVFLINSFYAIMIPLIVGGFAVFIATDVFRQGWNRVRGKNGIAKEP